ncbi:hypothetical protein C8R43DRAFT_1189332 [Mycena crocata]|nr:hypothetical protein C8R43DRAFT_1189332 [Mycena crocata]
MDSNPEGPRPTQYGFYVAAPRRSPRVVPVVPTVLRCTPHFGHSYSSRPCGYGLRPWQAKAILIASESRDILACPNRRRKDGRISCARRSENSQLRKCGWVANLQCAKPLMIESQSADALQATRALILVPTRQLSEQVSTYLKDPIAYCEDQVISNLASGTTTRLQRTLLFDKPDIVVAILLASPGTDSVESALMVSSLESLVIDEADLILSYGHDEDVQQIFGGAFLPEVYQSSLVSATMTEDVEILKGLTLRNPALLELEEGEDEAAKLSQYSVRCTEEDKFLLTYVILKLRLIKAKCILRSWVPRMREKASRGGGVEAESDVEEECTPFTLPLCRADLVQSFLPNEAHLPRRRNLLPPPKKGKRSASPAALPAKKQKGKKGKASAAKEYSVARGVDFVDVACVLNFDLPMFARAYTHRVGRTARAGRTGMALSSVSLVAAPAAKHLKDDEAVFARIEREQGVWGSKVKKYHFDMMQVVVCTPPSDECVNSTLDVSRVSIEWAVFEILFHFLRGFIAVEFAVVCPIFALGNDVPTPLLQVVLALIRFINSLQAKTSSPWGLAQPTAATTPFRAAACINAQQAVFPASFQPAHIQGYRESVDNKRLLSEEFSMHGADKSDALDLLN